MKRYSIFKNAYNAYLSGNVWKDGESETRIYYTVTDSHSGKEHQVIIEFDETNKIIKMRCDCTIASLKCKHLPLCSHMMAAIQRSVYDFGRPRKK